MKTSFPKPAQAQWYIVDAADQVLGRLSTKIATVLRGRHRPSYVPHLRSGDHVVVINAEKVKVSGAKEEQKMYHRHTGYLGHLRTKSLKHMREDSPEKIIQAAVKGMLPKNLTRQHTMKHLHVFAGATHGHEAQQPGPFPLPL